MAATEEPAGTQVREVDRYPDGYIPASRWYIYYEGQVIVRTRYATHQRWKKEGGQGRGRERWVAPSILGPDACRGERPDADPMNPELDGDEFSVYYTKTGVTFTYRVLNDDEVV